MYCPVVIRSPDLSLDMNEKQRNESAFVSATKLYCTMSVEITSEWMRTISLANVGSCEPFPHMSIPKLFLTSLRIICPKFVLKTTRLDSSFAKYTFNFCVTPLTLILTQVSLWWFHSCMRVLKASTLSIMEGYSRKKL